MDVLRCQVVVVFCVLLHIYQGFSFNVNKERRMPKDWQEESLERGPVSQMTDVMKRSKALRFYGLMGKRSGLKQPVQKERRRNKGEMFVGLMGWSLPSRDWQEEWARLHYS